MGTPQINLPMAYDINTDILLLSRIYERKSVDKGIVKDLANQVEFRKILRIGEETQSNES